MIDNISAAAPRFILRLLEVVRIIEKHSLIKDSCHFSEVGPGLGDLAHWIVQSPKVQGATLIESSEDASNLLKQKFAGFSKVKIVNDIELVPKENSDLIFCFEVLEHIEDDRQFLNLLRTMLKKDGVLVGSVPAYMKKWQSVDEWAGHVRRYERKELEVKLETSGFELIEMFVYGFPFTNLLYPLRQLYYFFSNSKKVPRDAATSRSGISREFTGELTTLWMYYFLKTFRFLQRLPLLDVMGDGFIFVVRKKPTQ
ncbi:class I SAM-dependent methyltransferase [uncultured Marinobacter sp.]|uniref:class I SAM-dependent methyltransferase n=1 Tax=uncultured Marinobacter sp. TaxID=187379 RepID=UPI00261BB709|nr:class I SAM-dependent methyltransferase [uncultured Marinobacter sp.]